MSDYLAILEKYKKFKEISDLVEEVKKLRKYYCTRQYVQMQQHINRLMQKYSVETFLWNKGQPYTPADEHESFINAEAFLWAKAQLILIENGVKLQDKI